MKSQLKSFGYAFRGIGSALKEEGHLRFHLVAAVYVIALSFFYQLSAVKWAVVLILIALIIFAELINTAIEKLCDLITGEYDLRIKFIKDVSAAAVLVLSFAAVATAFIFYFDVDKIKSLCLYFFNNPILLILLIVSIIISVVFIWAGPTGIKKFFSKKSA